MPFLDIDGDIRELPPGETIVGSGTQAGFRFSNVDLSARHFVVSHEAAGRVRVRPVSTQHIVTLNGRQVPHDGAELEHGDAIAAGAAEFVYVEDAERSRPERAPSSVGTAYLVDTAGRVAYPLSKKSVSVGRDVASHIVVRDPSVSRFHADVRAEAQQFVLYAQGSAGTSVNGHGVNAPTLLEEGDEIGVGAHTFRFTRQPLGQGIRPTALGSGGEEDTLSRKPTELSLGTVTGSNSRLEGGARRPLFPIVAALVVVIGVVAYLLLLR